jgi:hypothetical protein
MPTATITFTVNPPVEATDEQILEWVNFEMGVGDWMKIDNPLILKEMEPITFDTFKITK